MTLHDDGAEREVISRAELARRLSVSKARVTQVCQEGRLGAAALPSGRIVWPDALTFWTGNRDPQAELQAATRQDAAPAPPAEMTRPEAAAPEGSWTAERVRSERVRRQIMQMDLAERQGRLIARRQVEEAQATVARRLRDVMSREIERWAAPLAEVTGQDEQALRGWLRGRAADLQTSLSQTMSGLAEDAPAEDGGSDNGGDLPDTGDLSDAA